MTFRLAALTLLILVAFSFCTKQCVLGSTKDDARASIAAANNIISVCYDGAAEAGAAGANVSTLLSKLFEAGNLLSKAERAYTEDRFDSAFDYANESQAMLNDFAAEAKSLEQKAAYDSYVDPMLTIGGSIVGAVAIVCCSFAVWCFFKKKI